MVPTTLAVDASVAAEAWWQPERREPPSIIVRVSARILPRWRSRSRTDQCGAQG